jgi:hypothetical protein
MSLKNVDDLYYSIPIISMGDFDDGRDSNDDDSDHAPGEHDGHRDRAWRHRQ